MGPYCRAMVRRDGQDPGELPLLQGCQPSGHLTNPATPASFDLMVNGRVVTARGGCAPTTTTLLAWLRATGSDRQQGRLRRGRLRRVQRGPRGPRRRRQADLPSLQQLHRAPPDVRRPRDRDRRGPRAMRHGQTAAPPRPGRDGRALRLAMWLLHAGLRRLALRGLPPQGLPRAVADQRPALRQSLPLHRLPADPGCGGRGTRAANP